MSQEKRNKILRIAGIILLGLLLIAGLGGLWLNSNYKSIIQKKLPGIAAKATDSLYQVKAGDVDINLLDRKVVITDFELIPDEDHIARLKQDFNLPKMLLKIHIDKIIIDDIAWGEVLRTKEIVCGSMDILHPVIRITKLVDGPKDSTKEKQPSSIQAIKAGRITILNPDVAYTDGTDKKAASYTLKGGRIDLTDWKYDLRQPNDSSRLFYASNTAFRLEKFSIQQPDALSRMGFGAISYDQAAGTMRVNDLKIMPAISRQVFYQRVGFQKEIYDVHVPEISLDGLDWKALLQRKALMATGGRVSNASISIFMSRVPPLNIKSKNGMFPQQMLMKLKMPVHIPRLEVRNGKLAYTEKNEQTMQEGAVIISTINGQLLNITNIPERLRVNNICSVGLKGNFKGSELKAAFRFKINSKAGAFTVDGEQGAMDGTKLNDITGPLALAEIKTLQLKTIRFHLEGDESGAHGQFSMPYQDLKADLLEKQDGGLDKKDFTTFVAGKLLMHPNNPEAGKELRVARPSFKRDETKSFFNLVWKTIFSGALESVSRKAVRLDKQVNKRQEKREEKRKKEEQKK